LFLVISSIAFITYIYFGIFIILLDPESKKHRAFLLSCLTFAWWSFCTVMLHLQQEIAGQVLWFRLGFLGEVINGPITFRFVLLLTGFDRKLKYRHLLYLCTWIAPLFLVYLNLVHNLIYLDYPFGCWYLFASCCMFTLNFISVSLIYVWGKRSPYNREKKQSRILIAGGLAVMIICGIINFTSWCLNLFTQASSFVLIWIITVCYTLWKYRFLAITPELISRNVLGRMDDSVIMFNKQKEVVLVNEKTTRLLNLSQEDMINKPVSLFIKGFSLLTKDIESLFKGNRRDNFSTRLSYVNKNKQMIVMTARFSLVKDRFDDTLGILLLATEVEGIKHFKAFYSLTDRELEVIHFVRIGLPYEQIAQRLAISRRTVKAHVSHIYNKLRISNRIQLLDILKKFDLL
jgi:DNA-binding CsgD family transcriptional regulator